MSRAASPWVLLALVGSGCVYDVAVTPLDRASDSGDSSPLPWVDDSAADTVPADDSEGGSDSGGTDTSGASDTADDLHQGEMTAAASDCAFVEMDAGWLIECWSEWSEADAALLDGGTVYINTLDASLASVFGAAVDISTVASGDVALLEGTLLRFWLSGFDETAEYTVYYWVETRDGSMSSDEIGYAVGP